jgi:hypothetical protein
MYYQRFSYLTSLFTVCGLADLSFHAVRRGIFLLTVISWLTGALPPSYPTSARAVSHGLKLLQHETGH